MSAADASAPERRTAWPRALSSARTRILASYVLLLGLSAVVSIVAIRQILLTRLDERVDDTLVQDANEFRRLVGGVNPRTGKPFGSDVESLFDVYLARNVPAEDEALIAFSGGRLYKEIHSGPDPLELVPDAGRRWARLKRPERGNIAGPAGSTAYLAVPVALNGATRGTLVVTQFLGGERREVDDAMRVATAVSAVVLILASLLAFASAGRVLAPLRVLTDTARSITESDLSRRIPTRGRDEIAELARTFNAMLDRLEVAFTSQQQLLNDASHELRTPITIVRGHLELLGHSPDERRETVDLVMDELDRMSRLVDDLVLLAKAERPDFLRPEPLDVRGFSHELLAKASALARRDWRLESAASGSVVVDRHRLTQAMMNLAENAARHTTDGHPIFLGSAVEEGGFRLWVRDTGTGIDRVDHARIFDRFARAGDGQRRSEGAGLGLTIVRAIAEAHGGSVQVSSRPRSGSTFTIVIPGVATPRSIVEER